jgi:hypothetical protein
LHPKITRSALQTGQIALLPSALEFLCPVVYPKLSFCNQPIEQTRQDPGHRFDGFQTARLSPQVSVVPHQILRRKKMNHLSPCVVSALDLAGE